MWMKKTKGDLANPGLCGKQPSKIEMVVVVVVW